MPISVVLRSVAEPDVFSPVIKSRPVRVVYVLPSLRTQYQSVHVDKAARPVTFSVATGIVDGWRDVKVPLVLINNIFIDVVEQYFKAFNEYMSHAPIISLCVFVVK